MKTTLPGLNVLLMLSLLTVAGCDEAAIEEQAVPEGSETIAEPARPEPRRAPEAAPEQAADDDARAWPWTAPEGWRFVDEARPMRLATYAIETDGGMVEVAISRFPGAVGGMVANVNRWRGQIGLPPVDEVELTNMLERFENPGFVGHTMHLQGPEQHILAASIHERDADRTWFVRVTSDAESAGAVKDEVFAFARTFGAGG